MIATEIVRLAATASVEINVQDAQLLEKGRDWLQAGTTLYISHLPGQSWQATIDACRLARAAGYEPVPHMPARLVESRAALDRILGGLADAARPRSILVISGDYPSPAGPYSSAAQVLAAGALEHHGYTEVALAGHPEGHPKVDLEEIRRAEREKPGLALEHGLAPLMLTQFLFESRPFVEWACALQARGTKARLVCGLAGPAKITTLFRYATRCGVGASIRALGARPNTVMNLLGDHGPDRMIRELAMANLAGQCLLSGVHLFSFGGFIRTAAWLAATARGS
jgi:methylenetetrahydrofolate reductase (NADPH)